MSKDNEINELLSNIQKCLDVYTISELSKALRDVLDSKYNKGLYVRKVFDLVSSLYGIRVKDLVKSKSRGESEMARRMCYCLLKNDVKLSLGYISNSVFYRAKSSISKGVNYLNKCEGSKIKHEIEFVDNYKRLKLELVKFINENKINKYGS